MSETIKIESTPPLEGQSSADVTAGNKSWFYTDIVKDHFFNPRNLFKTNEEAEMYEYDGMGMVGSPACVSGDTLIAVADGRISVPIKKLTEEGKDVHVYCYDGEKINISTAKNFRKTREKVPLIKLELEDGSSLKLTADHQLMLRDGTYIEARDLKIGDSLMPFHKVIRKGYFYVYLNNGERKREHLMVYEHHNGSIENSGIKNHNIHHLDENKLNNNMKNLQLLSGEEHSKLHSIKHKKHLEGVTRNIKGDKNPMRAWWNNASEKEIQLYKLTMSFATSGEKNGRWKNISNGEILKEAYEFFIVGNKYLTNRNWREFAKEKDFPQCVDPRFKTFNEFKEMVFAYNHRVKSVKAAGSEDVYNMTVDNFHNYAIITNEDDVHSGIISKNCGDMMKIWIQVKDGRIKDCKWQTFGSLIKGEKVMLPDYTSKEVEKISINSTVLNEDNMPVIVEENLVKDYSGKMLTINLSTSKFYNFSVTPNHPIPCIERKRVSRINRKRGERWSEIDDTKLQKASSLIKPAGNLKPGDFLIFKIDKRLKDSDELDQDLCTLLGYYVSDGNLPSKNRVLFYFGLNEFDYLDELGKIAEKRKWNYKTFKRNTEKVFCFQLNEPDIAQSLRKHGGKPGNKHFSEEVMRLPAKKQMLVVDAYVKGDGWILKQNENWEEQYFISTSKENLSFQLQMMLARNRIFAPIHQREPREFILRGNKYKNNGEINLIFRKNKKYSRVKYHQKEHSFLIPISKINSFDYEGKIYDIGLSEEPKAYKIKGISVHNCASAIASTSMMSVMISENEGMRIEDAMKLKPMDIVKRLGDLPARKFHCSVLGDKALRAAINDYFEKTGQKDKVEKEKTRIIDHIAKVTDHDIEEAVLEGATTLEAVQRKTKAGIGNKSCLPEVEQLIRFYKEKYYGAD